MSDAPFPTVQRLETSTHRLGFTHPSFACYAVTESQASGERGREEPVTPTGHSNLSACCQGSWDQAHFSFWLYLSGQIETKWWKLLRQKLLRHLGFVFSNSFILFSLGVFSSTLIFYTHMHWINSPVFFYLTAMPTLLIQGDTEKKQSYILFQSYISGTFISWKPEITRRDTARVRESLDHTQSEPVSFLFLNTG